MVADESVVDGGEQINKEEQPRIVEQQPQVRQLRPLNARKA